MASAIRQSGCICSNDLLLTNVNKVKGNIVFIYNCSNINCLVVSIFKDERKKYNHIKLESADA